MINDETQTTEAEGTEAASQPQEPAPPAPTKAATKGSKKKAASKAKAGTVDPAHAKAGRATGPLKPAERTEGHPDCPK